MDLSKIQENFTKGRYSKASGKNHSSSYESFDLTSFAYDVRLLWSNCRKFNEDSSFFVWAGNTLSNWFEDRLEGIVNDLDARILRTTSQCESASHPLAAVTVPAKLPSISVSPEHVEQRAFGGLSLVIKKKTKKVEQERMPLLTTDSGVIAIEPTPGE